MPDLHRLPFYALAGTQNAITLTQVITFPNWRCQDAVISFACPPFGFYTVAHRNSAAYMTGKHAVDGLMRSIALDFASSGIRTNCVFA
jgi:NAD(P)-dependent dehydrogenase (short-subunit alcohol dehydrogenase family)